MTPQQRDAIKAFGQFVVTLEHAFRQEVVDPPTSQEKDREVGGLQIAGRLFHTQLVFLRMVIDFTAMALGLRDGEMPQAAR